MAPQSPPPAGDNKKPAAANAGLVPPEEQFWQRYSPHHEAPLSGIGSFAIHFLIGGFLVLAGALGWLGLGSHRGALPTDTVSLDIGGGGGSRSGTSETPGDGGQPREAVPDGKADETQKPADPSEPARPELKDPAVVQQNLAPELANDQEIQRFVREGHESLQQMASLNKDIQNKLREGIRDKPKGQGGSGSGGGKGSGTGTGEGSATGAGRGTISQRERRMLRWTMQFDTRSGQDYLRQLRELGAILAIPKDREGNQYWIIRDLAGRPPKLLDEDVSSIQRIFWIDDKPNSVFSVMRALGLNLTPNRFVAFMPQELEEKLFDEELKYRNLSEDQIDETIFKIIYVGGRATPVVASQRQKQ